MSDSVPKPTKTRVMQNHHIDSEKWNDFPIRDDDVIIATAYKSGTTWMQNIVLRLTYQGRPLPENTSELCPWLDLRVPPIEVQQPQLEGIKDRRQIKTHLPLNALKYSDKAKYIYIARDGRDCYMAWVNHWRNGNDKYYELISDSPGRVGPGIPRFDEALHSEPLLFDRWISEGNFPEESDGWPMWSVFDGIQSFWNFRHLPNILFVHYSDLLEDLEGGVREVAAFLDIPIIEEEFADMLEALSFKGMKASADDPVKTLVPLAGAVFSGGGKTFINQGTNGRWKGVLSEAQLKKYDETVAAKLTPECAAFLEAGKKAFHPKTV